VWKREEIEAITARLQNCREELNLHVLVNLRYLLPILYVVSC
jgi:hypothetical protein